VAYLGAATQFDPTHLKSEAVAPLVAQSSLFYVEGYFLTSCLAAVMQLAQAANASDDKRFCLNISAGFIAEHPSLMEVMPYVDYLFANDSEYLAFAKKQGLPNKDIVTIAMNVAALPMKRKQGKRTVVITQGSQQTVVAITGAPALTYEVPKLDPKLIVDANGAGDAFVGGFLAMLSKKQTLENCVHAGHFASRQIMQTSGTKLPRTRPDSYQ